MKWDFLRSVLAVGTPEGRLAPQLKRWVGELHTPVKLDSYGRFINRFKLGTTVQVVSPDMVLAVGGMGFFRPVCKHRDIELESFRDRGVISVVASFAEGLAWAEKRTGMQARLFSTANCEMQVSKFGNVRLGKLSGIERTRELLFKTGVLLEGKHQPVLSGNGGRRGFWFRCGMNWGYSPVAMFLALTAFKLAVVNPELVPVVGNDPFAQLMRFYGWYKGLDDDARLAHGMMVGGLGDLALAKGRSLYESWMVDGSQPTLPKWPGGVGYLKTPTPESMTVMLSCMQGKRPHVSIKAAHVPCVQVIPAGFVMLGKSAHLPFTKSCYDVLLPSKVEVFIEANKPWAMQIPLGMGDAKKISAVLGASVVETGAVNYVLIGENWFQRTPGAAKKIRKVLLMLKGVTTFGEIAKGKPTGRFEPLKPEVKVKVADKRILFLGER